MGKQRANAKKKQSAYTRGERKQGRAGEMERGVLIRREIERKREKAVRLNLFVC